MNLDLDPSQFNDIPDPLADGGVASPLPAQPLVEKGVQKGSHAWPTAGIRRGAALAAAVVSQLVWLVVMNWRSDLDSSPRARIAFEVALPLATAAIAFWAAGSPGRLGLGNPRGRIGIAMAAGATLFAAGTWLVTAIEESDPLPFWFHVARCAAYITAFASAPFGLALWAYARAFVTLSSWRTCALGVGCGAVGAATMGFVCETESAAHVVIGHGLAMVVGGFVGALVARRVTTA